MKQNERFQIIEADNSHADFLADFGRRSFADAYKETLSLSDLEEYTKAAFSKSNITAEINDPSVTYFVCRDLESNLCGYAKLILSPPPVCIDPYRTIELQRLYVDESYRGQGIENYCQCMLRYMPRIEVFTVFGCGSGMETSTR